MPSLFYTPMKISGKREDFLNAKFLCMGLEILHLPEAAQKAKTTSSHSLPPWGPQKGKFSNYPKEQQGRLGGNNAHTR